MTYQVGRVYIWQNQVGQDAVLNGTECMVTSNKKYHRANDGSYHHGWETDTQDPVPPFNGLVCAEEGDLREKQPPTGEASILNMFVVAPPKRMKEVV